MNNNIVIRAEGLSKLYHIGRKQEKYKTLRDTLTNAFVSPFRRAGKLLKGQTTGAAELDETIWALKDISFEIKKGEVVGIIGRNGAGKSTLLKILSRITEPTKGFAEIYGRVGSLLEVGTGFHSELTGRENIYLNGAILGMKRAEIDRKFDEIVAFAEVEKFIDTPVKHYSSGMYLRLAFAVAAHLEPEILLVDEVLAVGDVAFQKKCMGKMEDVAKEGRTILFVSHNMAAIGNLCTSGIYIDEGQLVVYGETKEVIERYLANISKISNTELSDRKDRRGIGEIKVVNIELLNHDGKIVQSPISGQELIIRLHYKSFVDKVFRNCRASVVVIRNEVPYFNLSTDLVDTTQLNLSGEGYIDFIIPELPLSQSNYYLHSFIEANKEIQDWVLGAVEMSVVDGDFYGKGRNYPLGWQGIGVLVKHSWRYHNFH
jgi:lipopolysaccharide transport system ATP-binding protein